jgi:ABC-type sugar transport system substrate-binding protein
VGSVAIVAAVSLAACGSSSNSNSGASSTSGATTSGATTSGATTSGATTSASTGSGTTPASSGASFTPTGSGGLALTGSAGTQQSESNKPLGIQAQTGAAQKAAIAAADKVAAKLGSGTIPKGTTIGLEEIINSVSSSQRADGQLLYGLRELGLKVIPCDAEGDPSKMESCMTSLVSQNVKAIMSLGTDPSLIAQGLQDAKSHHIPVISYSGAVAPSPLWYRVYYPDERKAGQILGKYVVSQLKAHGGGGVWINNYPASWAAERTDGLTAALKGSGLSVAGNTTVDSTNPIAGTQQQVIAQYTKDPSTKAYWFAYDSPGAAGAQALASKDAGKSWPSGPLVVTFHDDQQANGLIRKGQITAVDDVDYDASSFEADNALAQLLAKKPVPPSDTGATGQYGQQMYSYPVITKSSNPPAGKFVEPKFDVVSFYAELWHKEFGLK